MYHFCFYRAFNLLEVFALHCRAIKLHKVNFKLLTDFLVLPKGWFNLVLLSRVGVLLGLEQFLQLLFLLDILVDVCAPERYLDCALTLTASSLLDMKWKLFWLFLRNRGPKL